MPALGIALALLVVCAAIGVALLMRNPQSSGAGALVGGWVMADDPRRWQNAQWNLATCICPGHFELLSDDNAPIDLGHRPALRACWYTVGGAGVGGGSAEAASNLTSPDKIHKSASKVRYTDASGNARSCNGVVFDIEANSGLPYSDATFEKINRAIAALRANGYSSFVACVEAGSEVPQKSAHGFTHLAIMMYGGNNSYAGALSEGYYRDKLNRAAARGWELSQVFLTFQSFSASFNSGGAGTLETLRRVMSAHKTIAGVLGWPAYCDPCGSAAVDKVCKQHCIQNTLSAEFAAELPQQDVPNLLRILAG